MKRWLVLLAACGGRPSDAPPGVSGVRVHLRDTYIELAYTLRPEKALAQTDRIEEKAACQVGADRFVDAIGAYEVIAAGEAKALESAPFITNPLPGRASLCELTIAGERFCMDEEHFTRGACKPNPVTGPATRGVSARLVSVRPGEKDDLGFPAHLTVEYVVTAHADMPRGAWAVRVTECAGSHDDTWHHELEDLRAGESFHAAQNTYRLGAQPGVRCTTRFGIADKVNGEVTVVGEACHVDDKIVPCT